MCGNRVEELESRVKELEASVEGLTDELVECKVRLRELENAVDTDIGFSGENPGPRASRCRIVPRQTPRRQRSRGQPIHIKPRTPQLRDNREESEADSGSDIIVA